MSNNSGAFNVSLSMRPNVDGDLLFKCACAGDHFMEVYAFEDEPWLWFHVLQERMSLWGILSRWWKSRSFLVADVGLTESDAVALRERLDDWLKSKAPDMTPPEVREPDVTFEMADERVEPNAKAMRFAAWDLGTFRRLTRHLIYDEII